MLPTKLTEHEIASKISLLHGWEYKNNAIEKQYVFKDFSEAFGFIGRVGLLAEKYGHHPDWSGVYNKVNIKLSTHEAGGVTENDILLAEQMEKYTMSL